MSIVKYIGVDDPDLDLFESQYDVPEGMCYNSYLVEGSKIAIMDTVDSRKTKEWIEKLENALNMTILWFNTWNLIIVVLSLHY